MNAIEGHVDRAEAPARRLHGGIPPNPAFPIGLELSLTELHDQDSRS
jgi:hypothetical protein